MATLETGKIELPRTKEDLPRYAEVLGLGRLAAELKLAELAWRREVRKWGGAKVVQRLMIKHILDGTGLSHESEAVQLRLVVNEARRKYRRARNLFRAVALDVAHRQLAVSMREAERRAA